VGATSRFLDVNGLKLHYLDWGNETAPPLVLLHAYPVNAHSWDAVAPSLAAAFHVVAPDARGHGDSDWAPVYDTDTFTSDLHGLLDALNLGVVTLCGNSLGGGVAMHYAGTYPDEVARLILVDTGAPAGPAQAQAGPPPGAARPPPFPLGPFASEDEAARLVEPTLSAIGSAGAAGAVVSQNMRSVADGKLVWKPDMAGLAGGLARAMGDPRRFTTWAAVHCPTLIVRGANSPLLSPETGEAMVAQKPNATFVEIPNAGHFVAMEQPEAFIAAVNEWL
jgi:pimeloyl-ACP methyl ester carboxylesterase